MYVSQCKAVGKDLWLGGQTIFGGITLTYQKDTILYISTTVISNIQWAMGIF